MKSRLLLLLSILLFLQYNSFAGEDYIFQILVNHGDVSIGQSATNDKIYWTKAKTGAKLYATDKIMLKRGAYIALFHRGTKKAPDIKTPGTYDVSELEKNLKADSLGLGEKFFDYVVKQINGGDDLFSAGSVGEMSVTAAVPRTVTEDSLKKKLSSIEALRENELKNTIILKAPRAVYLMDDTISLEWYGEEDSYTLHIRDKNNNELYEAETDKTSAVLNLDVLDIEKGASYYWFVSSGDKKSSEFIFYRMSEDELTPINQTLDMVSKKRSAIENIILASYFDKLNLVFAARDAYLAALEQAPDVDEYQYLYCDFLYRAGMFDEALEIFGDI